jgi:ribosomal protein S18 acetylase RimI-like enzyme
LPLVSEYKKLRDSVGWWETDEKATEIALQNSLFSVVATEHNDVVGFGRIVGDGGLYFYIQDLIVHPKFQNNGLGRRLMDELISYLRGNANSGAFVGLMAAKGLEEYYESFGFKARDEDAPGMYQVIK